MRVVYVIVVSIVRGTIKHSSSLQRELRGSSSLFYCPITMLIINTQQAND